MLVGVVVVGQREEEEQQRGAEWKENGQFIIISWEKGLEVNEYCTVYVKRMVNGGPFICS